MRACNVTLRVDWGQGALVFIIVVIVVGCHGVGLVTLASGVHVDLVLYQSTTRQLSGLHKDGRCLPSALLVSHMINTCNPPQKPKATMRAAPPVALQNPHRQAVPTRQYSSRPILSIRHPSSWGYAALRRYDARAAAPRPPGARTDLPVERGTPRT